LITDTPIVVDQNSNLRQTLRGSKFRIFVLLLGHEPDTLYLRLTPPRGADIPRWEPWLFYEKSSKGFAPTRQDCKFGKQLQFFFGGGQLQCWGADIFRVLLYCYSLLAMSTVSVTEYTNIVVIK